MYEILFLLWVNERLFPQNWIVQSMNMRVDHEKDSFALQMLYNKVPEPQDANTLQEQKITSPGTHKCVPLRQERGAVRTLSGFGLGSR